MIPRDIVDIHTARGANGSEECRFVFVVRRTDAERTPNSRRTDAERSRGPKTEERLG
jgi:hypothetical protein